MKKKLFGALAAVCALAATLVASSACIWYLYQPEEPEALSDKYDGRKGELAGPFGPGWLPLFQHVRGRGADHSRIVLENGKGGDSPCRIGKCSGTSRSRRCCSR